MHFIKTCNVRRSGLDVEEFATTWSADEAVQKLSTGGHDWVEYLTKGDVTKLYFDAEKYYPEQPDSSTVLAFELEVRSAMEAIMDALMACKHAPSVSYVLAQRHGFVDDGKRYKLSFRPFVLGVAILYHAIPDFLAVIGCPMDAALWDLSVYKASEQLLAAVNGRKSPGDQRRLTPMDKEYRVEDYIAQHVDREWQVVDWQEAEVEVEDGRASMQCDLADNQVVSLVRCLGPQTASDYNSWIKVGLILKSIDPAAYLGAFVEFSRLGGASFMGDEDCQKKWDKLNPKGRLTIGTLHFYAKRDNAAAYAAWRLSIQTPDGLTAADRAALLNALVTRFPGEFSSVDVDTFVLTVRPGAGEIDFMCVCADCTSPVSGFVNKDCTVSLVDDGGCVRFLGLLFSDVPVKDCMTSYHADIDPDWAFVFNRIHADRAELRSVIPDMATLTEYNIGCDNAFLQIAVKNKRVKSVTSSKVVASVNNMIQSALDAHAERMSMPWLTVNALVINNTNNYFGQQSEDSGRQADEDLVKSIIAGCGDLRFAPDIKTGNCNGLFCCDPTTHIWRQQYNSIVEEKIVKLFEAIKLSPVDRRHVLSRRGRADMVHLVACKRVDEKLSDKLDASLDIFAVDNGCFDSSSASLAPTFREVMSEDYVRTTAGWSYDAVQAADKKEEVLDFLAKVLPVAEERHVVLSYFADLLSGRRVWKKFLAFTDRRSGNNGKTTLLTLFSMFFGAYAASNTKFVCKGSLDRDRDSHDARTEPMRGKRLLVAEELKGAMTLDEAMLKRLTGGDDTAVSGRKCGSAETYNFVWQAGFVLIFNEGDCPKFDTGDAAFMQRMIVVPMRSKFVHEPIVEGGEEWTYPVDISIKRKFRGWLPALADILVSVFPTTDAARQVFERLPVEMREWRQGISAEGNPYAEWLEQRVRVTGDLKDVIVLAELKNEAHGDRTFSRFAMAYFRALEGVQATDKTVVKVDGKWVSMRGVIRGVARVPTSSASERRFKKALEKEMGCEFQSGVHPKWLVNEVTRCTMELDLYNEEKGLAVEYDGPQHYEFPNGYHKSEAEFVALQNRDRQKDVACEERMITLVRVRASDLVVEIQSFKEQMDVLLPQWRSWCTDLSL